MAHIVGLAHQQKRSSFVTDRAIDGHQAETMHSRGAMALLVVGAVACGGKILEDPDGGAANAQRGETSGMTGGGSRPPTTTSATQPTPPSTPPSSDISLSDACSVVCKRNGHCGGADQVACESDCVTSAKGACASSYVAFTKCFALTLDPESCAMVPPSCESAYCTYVTCAGKPQLDYCD